MARDATSKQLETNPKRDTLGSSRSVPRGALGPRVPGDVLGFCSSTPPKTEPSPPPGTGRELTLMRRGAVVVAAPSLSVALAVNVWF
jgi:hypothetical protein